MIKILMMLPVIMSISCATVDIYFNKTDFKEKPSTILIGYFERRLVNYQPYIIKDLRDALAFNFFKLKYTARLYEVKENKEAQDANDKNYILDGEAIKNQMAVNSSDIFIQGSVSERVTGDLADAGVSTSVTVMVYNKTGVKIGEARYMISESMADARTLVNVTKTLALKLHHEFTNLSKFILLPF